MSGHPTVYRPELSRVETRVSSYDRLNAFLTSSLMMVGAFVLMLFMLWLSSRPRSEPPPSDVVFEIGEPGEDKPEGVADDVLEPGVEEFPEVETPQLADSLLAVTSAVSTIQARNEQRDGSAEQMGKGRGLGSRDGGGGGGSGVPGWEVNLEARDKGSYAKQLSYFKFEISAVHKVSTDVYRMADPAGTKQVTRTNRAEEKRRKSVFWGQKNRLLQEWDKDLIRSQVPNLDDYVVGQIFPQEVINRLRSLEIAYAEEKGRTVEEVRTTSFRIIQAGSGFEFQVSGQTYKR